MIQLLVLGLLVGVPGQNQERVKTAALTQNIDARLVAACISERRGRELVVKVTVKADEKDKELVLSFPAHSFMTHETTLMNVVYSCVAPRGQLGHDWKDSKLAAVFSIPKDFRGHNDWPRCYLVSIGGPVKP